VRNIISVCGVTRLVFIQGFLPLILQSLKCIPTIRRRKMGNDWISPKTYEWAEPSFAPEIDLNFLGLNTKVVITFSKEKKDE